MSLEFTVEVWDALRTHIDSHERKEAADTLVNLLIEHNHEAAEIKTAFREYKDVISALKYYTDQHDDTETDEWSDEDDEDDMFGGD